MSLTVDHGSLRKAAKDVRAARGEVDGELRQLSGVVSNLGGQWKGQAASSFASLMTRFNDDATKLLNALDDIAQMLELSANRHQATDEDQQTTFSSFDGALGV